MVISCSTCQKEENYAFGLNIWYMLSCCNCKFVVIYVLFPQNQYFLNFRVHKKKIQVCQGLVFLPWPLPERQAMVMWHPCFQNQKSHVCLGLKLESRSRLSHYWLKTFSWLLEIDCWKIIVGYWVMKIDCWRLIAGYWLLCIFTGSWLLNIDCCKLIA